MNDDQSGDDHTTPEMNSDDTSTIAVILAEVRDTAPTGTPAHVAEMIRSRLERAGIRLSHDEVDNLAIQVVGRDE